MAAWKAAANPAPVEFAGFGWTRSDEDQNLLRRAVSRGSIDSPLLDRVLIPGPTDGSFPTEATPVVCSGDSGGPLVATLPGGERVVAGIASFADQRCQEYSAYWLTSASEEFIAGFLDAPSLVSTAAPTTGTAPLTTTFDLRGTTDPDGIARYSVDPGDDRPFVSGTSPVLTHTYTAPGIFPASVCAQDLGGHLSCRGVDVVVTGDSEAPSIQVSHSPRTGAPPLAVTFDLSGSSDDGAVTGYTVDPGDGTPPITQATPVITHTYATAGNWFPTVEVTDDDGYVSFRQLSRVEVRTGSSSPPGTTPVVVAAASPTSGIAPLTVTFDLTGTGGGLDWYGVAPGDSSGLEPGGGTAEAFTHTYEVPGTYTATMYAVSGEQIDFEQVAIVVQPPPPVLRITDARVTEGTTATLTISRSSAAGTSAVIYRTSAGSAGPADFTARSGVVEFAAGQLARTITVPTTADALDELDETFIVGLVAPSNATIADATGVVTITDDDAPPRMSIGDLRVGEGNTGSRLVAVPITLDAPSGRTVQVKYSVTAGTARPGTDFAASATGSLTIAVGRTTVGVPLTIIGDRLVENAETVTVTLAPPTGATLIDGSAVVTIVDDDRDTTAPVVAAKADVVVETILPSGGTTAVTFTPPRTTDDFDGALTPTCTPPSGTRYGYGNFTVRCEAADRAGNLGSNTFRIIVRTPTFSGAVFSRQGEERLTTVQAGDGARVEVSAGAFTPGTKVVLRFVDAAGRAFVLRAAHAGTDGSLDAPIVVPRQAGTGPGEVLASSVAADGTEYDRAWTVEVLPPG